MTPSRSRRRNPRRPPPRRSRPGDALAPHDRRADERAAEALRDSEERLRLALKGGQMGLWDWDVATDQLVSDARHFALLGLPKRAGAVGIETFFERLHPDDRTRLRRALRRATRTETEFHHEFRVLPADGAATRWLAVKGRAFRDARGQPRNVIGVSYDITARKVAEQQLRLQARALALRVSERTAELQAMHQTLGEETQERRRLEQEILEVTEREQRRFGQDLHDGLGQMTTATAMMSERLARDLEDRSLKEEASMAHRLTELIHAISTEARRLSRGLSPVGLGADGLMSALEDLALSTTRLFHVPCRFHCPAPVLLTDRSQAVHLFRIAQEAVNNAVRHAQASRLEIELGREGERVHLAVRDDGRGLPRAASNGRGMGLRVMRYRARLIGAVLRFERGCPRGTVITCVHPHAPPPARLARLAVVGPRLSRGIPAPGPG